MISRMWHKVKEYVFGKGMGGETIRYLIVGGLTTLINFSLFVLMHEVMGVDSTVSNVTSISVSVLFAYVTNKLVVFRRRSDAFSQLAIEFLKFVGSRLFTMALEIGVVLMFDGALGWNATLGKAISQVLVIIGNYVISKLIVFKGSETE